MTTDLPTTPAYTTLRALDYRETTVVRVLAFVLDSRNFDQFLYELCDVIDRESPDRMVIDLTRVKYLHSLTLGTLCHFREQMRREGRAFRICVPQTQTLELFTATGLNNHFDIWDTVDAAIDDWLNKRPYARAIPA